MLKYTTEYRDRLDGLWRLEIDAPDYTGEPIALIPSENPVIKEYNGNSDDDIFKMHVIPSSLTINVVSTGLDIRELMKINDARYKCRLYRDGALDWQGYVVADNIQRVDSGVPYDVTIRAIDGLEVLNNVDYKWASGFNSITLDGEESDFNCPMNTLRRALYDTENLDNKLPIKWNTPLKNNQYPDSDMLAGLTQIDVQGSLSMPETDYPNAEGKSAYWFVDNISKSALSWCYQRGGKWVFDNYFYNGAAHELPVGSDIATTVSPLGTTQVLDTDTVNSDWFWFGKKALSKVSVLYNDTKFNGNNVLPNAGFERYALGILLDWGFVNSPLSLATIHDSISGRDGRSVFLANYSSSESVFTTRQPVPIDAETLFKSMVFNFTFMPLSGWSMDGSETILWDSKPLKVSIKFTLGSIEYYLNEFGFWQTEGRGLGLGVQYVRSERTSISLDTGRYDVYYSGTPNIGDTLVVMIRSKAGGNYNEYSFTVTESEEGNLELALIGLMNAVPDWIGDYRVLDKRIEMQSATEGRFHFSRWRHTGSPSGRTYKSSANQEYQYIYPTVENLKKNDVATLSFTGKGGNSEILIPQGIGHMQVYFYFKAGMEMVLDNVNLTVSDAHDVYELKSPDTKNSDESYDMAISSGYSGNMVSSYGDGYSNRDESMLWTGGKTLTQIYGEHILKSRSQPLEVFSGSIDKVVEWGVFNLMGTNYAPLSMSLDTKDLITRVTGIELINPDISIDVKHKSSSD